jgi:hypothetical protein
MIKNNMNKLIILTFILYNFIPIDENEGYFISYKNNIRSDVKVNDIQKKFNKYIK